MRVHTRASVPRTYTCTRSRRTREKRDADFLGHNANRARKRAWTTIHFPLLLFLLALYTAGLALKIEATYDNASHGPMEETLTKWRVHRKDYPRDAMQPASLSLIIANRRFEAQFRGKTRDRLLARASWINKSIQHPNIPFARARFTTQRERERKFPMKFARINAN